GKVPERQTRRYAVDRPCRWECPPVESAPGWQAAGFSRLSALEFRPSVGPGCSAAEETSSRLLRTQASPRARPKLRGPSLPLREMTPQHYGPAELDCQSEIQKRRLPCRWGYAACRSFCFFFRLVSAVAGWALLPKPQYSGSSGNPSEVNPRRMFDGERNLRVSLK